MEPNFTALDALTDCMLRLRAAKESVLTAASENGNLAICEIADPDFRPMWATLTTAESALVNAYSRMIAVPLAEIDLP